MKEGPREVIRPILSYKLINPWVVCKSSFSLLSLLIKAKSNLGRKESGSLLSSYTYHILVETYSKDHLAVIILRIEYKTNIGRKLTTVVPASPGPTTH